MMKPHELKAPIVVMGKDKTAISLAICVLIAGNEVVLVTTAADAESAVADLVRYGDNILHASATDRLCMLASLPQRLAASTVMIVSDESAEEKSRLLQQVAAVVPDDATVTVNTEGIPLEELQTGLPHPERLLGANWVEPVHTTSFLEVITNDTTSDSVAEAFCRVAKLFWGKDPYRLRRGVGIRSKIMAALVREACYLIENGYATVEDIDRACRNDAGYYLPFAGNFRYMDLMGTTAYGLVMKDLNPELCNNPQVSKLLTSIVNNGGAGMENKRGFYNYPNGEAQHWEERMKVFSHEIKDLMAKYPFNYVEEPAAVNNTSYR